MARAPAVIALLAADAPRAGRMTVSPVSSTFASVALRAIRRFGLAVLVLAAFVSGVSPVAASGTFPRGYEGFHTYAELTNEVAQLAREHADLVQRFSIGRSAEGRQLWAVRISEDVRVDHGRPEVLFDGLHHGLEHMGLEMTLAIFHWLVEGDGRDKQVTALLHTRVVNIVFAVNPDGAEYDIRGGTFHEWRKNRQPNEGSTALGTDLNRNYDSHWACCGRVSRSPTSRFYAGSAPFSAPETRALRDFIESRVIDGAQRITVAVSFHTSGRLILWPFAYTTRAIPADVTRDDHAVFVALARAMASRNGYTPELESTPYVHSGTAIDWEYGSQHIFGFTFELGRGRYQRDSMIGPETARNRSAILYLIGMANCPYRAVGTMAVTSHCQT